jgi:hypothetical protein
MFVPPRKRAQCFPLVAAPTVFVWCGETNAQVVTGRQSFMGTKPHERNVSGIGAYTPMLTDILGVRYRYDQRRIGADETRYLMQSP